MKKMSLTDTDWAKLEGLISASHEARLSGLAELSQTITEQGKKVDELYDVLTRTRTIKDFILLLFKLIAGLGVTSGAVVGTQVLYHKIFR